MSEESTQENFGKDSVEAAQGYTPMADTPKPEADFQGIDLNTAAAEHLSRKDDMAIVEREYHDGRGVRPKNESVELDRAVKDLGALRAEEFKVAEALRDKQLAEEIENLRSPLAKEVAEAQTATPEPQQAQEQLPPEQATEQQMPGVDPEVAAALQNPKVLAAINQQRAADWAEAKTVAQTYNDVTAANANIAVHALFARHPELRNLTREQLPIALNMIAQQNPAKYAEINAEIETVKALHQMSINAQQQQQQRAAAQFNIWADAQDGAFERELAKEAPERQTQLRTEARAMLRDFGLSDREIEHSWNTNPLLRSAAGQKVLMLAAAHRLQQRTAQTIRPTHQAPRVQRPGSSLERATVADASEAAALKQLDGLRGNEAARLGAQILARRARAR